MNFSLSYKDYLLFLALAVLGTMIASSVGSSSLVWADIIEGTEGPDFIIGTPVDDLIDSKGGDDFNSGDTELGDGSGNDVIVSGEGDDQSTGNGGRDIFVCGGGEEDTVTDYNQAEGDIAVPDCENV
jgi:Ca2+-binding RTX toxin-like protein